ncbi:MAG TPA: TasA family protein [Solirubrobacterales bacterium]|nr:TasA family protein [Solirubrobacterales bacterium]
MERIEILIQQPKRTIGVLAAVLLAVAVAVGSGANFTAQTANPGNTFASGTLTMSNSKDNVAILTAANMKPGDTASGTVDIQNTGSLSGVFSLSRTNLTNSDAINPMSQKLDLVVKDCGDFSAGTPTCDAGDPEKYNGTLDAMTAAIALGTYASNEKHRYEFTATFNSSAGDVYQGDSTSARFQWDAV